MSFGLKSFFKGLKGKRKEKKDKVRVHRAIDWRATPEDYFKIIFFGVICLYVAAWSSIIISSLLYLLTIGAIAILLFYAKDVEKEGSKIPIKAFIPFFLGLFFLIFSFSPSDEAYILGAYLSSLFAVIVEYFAVRKVIKEDEIVRRVFCGFA